MQERRTEPRILLGCPVLDLARLYDELARQWRAADDAGDPDDHTLVAHDRMQEIIEAASYLTPASKSGAAFQIMAASLQEDAIANGMTATIRKAGRVRRQRLLYRIMEWIELDDEELLDAGIYAMPVHLAPRIYR